MLEVCAEHAKLAGVELDLRLGDLRDPPVDERVPLVMIPFRSLLHLNTHDERRRGLRAVRRLLAPGGRFVFDVFTPSREDIEETNGRWLEREPEIFERADWDEAARTLTLSVRRGELASTMELAWLDAAEWRALLQSEGFVIDACYGWFDRRPYTGGEDTIWVARLSP
jgi:SAM-dependent methyltransferase